MTSTVQTAYQSTSNYFASVNTAKAGDTNTVYGLYEIKYTSGIKNFAAKNECFWLLDILRSFYKKMDEEKLQIWKVRTTTKGLHFTCINRNGGVIYTEEMYTTNTYFNDACIIIRDNVMQLPFEN